MNTRHTNPKCTQQGAQDNCPCGTGLSLDQCCGQIINGQTVAATAEKLMRSRYTAFVLKDAEYLLQSWHPDTRPSSVSFDANQRWLGLKIKHCIEGQIADQTGVVEFVARYKSEGKGHRLQEKSRFVRINGEWFYLDGEIR